MDRPPADDRPTPEPASPAPAPPAPATPAPATRSRATIGAEIAEVRRFLHEVPPHHGGGRDALLARLARLEGELARVRSSQPGT